MKSALREKLEDLLDTYDLQEAVKGASGFHAWEAVKQELKKTRETWSIVRGLAELV